MSEFLQTTVHARLNTAGVHIECKFGSALKNEEGKGKAGISHGDNTARRRNMTLFSCHRISESKSSSNQHRKKDNARQRNS
ncbi:hypothetical protein LSTR_LSTR004391 [Laodelphax striatellus]|uniref:Uncharacterized protein n=1 Tax=Laodelphax striatellus TaxID=195883 RepID=A0A482X5C4_LAOST|nr:hypothetical protein LSTR_LSTR016419 [Laodelphax striatellus]RZF42242.1 hypothetical protein LSTR_LSTR004391 [Laodelphax striatellus]